MTGTPPTPSQGLPAVSGELQTLLEYSLDILTVIDADGTWRYSSPAGTQLLGHQPGYDPEGGIFSLLHPDDLTTAAAAFAQLVAGEWDSSRAVELRVRAADGSYRILETYGRNLCDDPDVGGIVLNARDITDRRRAEEALRREDRRFRSLVAHASEYTLVWDADFLLTYVSPSVIEATDGRLHPGSNVIQEEMVHADDFSRTERDFGELLGAPTGTTRRLQFRLRLGPGASTGAGEYRWVDAIVTNLLEDPDVAGVVVNAQDVTERHEHEERLSHLAEHDALTGLPNRFAFEEQLERRLDEQVRHGRPLALCFIDLDHFKRVNDSLGHREGDELLRIVGRRICSVVRDDTFVARLGGDEFVVLADDTDLDGSEVLASRLLSAISRDVFLGSTRIHIGASIGVTVADALTPPEPQGLMRDVDVAMYEAKNRGRGQIVRFDVPLRDTARSRLELENALRRALARHELVVHYQPLIAATNRATVGLEALVRWERPGAGLLLPGAFLHAAEQSGLSARIEEEVLSGVLADLAAHPELPRTWVNLSVLELSRPRHARRLTAAAMEAGVSLDRLGFEVTETVLAADTETVRENLVWLRGNGARVALDDYGTGYASLANLRQLPIDELKIDQSLIAGMLSQPFDRTVVRAVIEIAHALHLEVVAEGVESFEQARMAGDLGVTTLQGYFFAPPMELDEARDVMRALVAGPAAPAQATQPR